MTPSYLDDLEAMLPSSVLEWLRSCPQTGGGVHQWLPKIAVRLHRYLSDKNDIAALIERHTANCGRVVDDDELWQAIDNTERWLANGGKDSGDVDNKAKHTKPRITPASPVDEALVASISKQGPTLDELSARSPIRWEDNTPHTEEILRELFPPKSLVCIGWAKDRFRTVSLTPNLRFKEFRNLQFIVPSPMTARTGCTKSGKVSAHCFSNTGPRRFLVVECDKGSFDVQASVLWHLSARAPLVMVVHSGGKSLHGWFFVEGKPEEDIASFLGYAVKLGADPATWLKSQFVRMPDGLRDNGKRQRVVFFDPKRMEYK
jgi:hypothetical protein